MKMVKLTKNKMEENIKINEEFHIPDPENVDVVISNLIDSIRNDISDEIYKHKNDLTRIQPFYIKLDPDENPCKWLGNDTLYFIDVNFSDKYPKPFGEFTYVPEYQFGQHFISIDDSVKEGFVIHGACIKISFSLYIHNAATRRDPLMNNVQKLESVIRHELLHIYKELFIQKKFQLQKKDDDESSKIIDANKKNVYDILSELTRESIKRNITTSKKNLLEIIYLSNYIERDAHVNGFYQRLSYDRKTYGKLDDINSYYEMNTYTLALEHIKKYNDHETFQQIKNEYIIPLFGGSASNMSVFIRRVKNALKNTISNMRSIYERMSVEGSLKKSYESLIQHKEEYEKEFYKNMYSLNEQDEFSKELQKAFSVMHYVTNPCEETIMWVDAYFNLKD
jgi:hypothetical protein